MKRPIALVSVLVLSLVLVTIGPTTAQPPEQAYEEPILPNCLVALIEEVPVPGEEPGVLVALEAKEGMQVTKGMVLGGIDDSEARILRDIKDHEYEVAKIQANDKIEIEYTTKASEVAYYTLQKSLLANKRTENTVVKVELKRLELEWQRAALGIEKAKLQLKKDARTALAKKAERDGAQLSINRRLIKSPFDGVVDKVYKHVGEWVAIGDPVVRIFRFDRLYVKGSLDAAKYSPHEIKGRGVTVEVELARGRRITATGKIVYVSAEVRLDGGYEVWAEIANRRENAEWIIRPGMPATMTIKVGNLASTVQTTPKGR